MVKSFALVGGQNGDEGKGKFVEYLLSCIAHRLRYMTLPGERNILLYRWQGGPNAGHTLVLEYLEGIDKVVKLHQIGSGIVIPTAYTFLGKGMYLDPRKLVKEIKDLQARNIRVTPDNLGISSKVHMILDYHTIDDQKNFNLAEHSSTGSGIKQTARDKYDRVGIRFIEFLDGALTLKILEDTRFPSGSGFPESLGDIGKLVASYAEERDFLAPFVAQEHDVFADPRFRRFVGEGAQGLLLDIDDGQYNGTTSSNPGLPTHRPDLVMGVYKMYVSSVGIKDRPFMSEMDRRLSEILVHEWKEFGTTTGKPRHIGWFDAVAGRYTAECAHMDYIIGSCLDRLESVARLGERLKICTAYEIDGNIYDKWHESFDRRDTLWRANPHYEEMEPWDQTVEKDGKTLTPDARRYVEAIEDLLGRSMVLKGIGPEHSDIIARRDIMNKILHLSLSEMISCVRSYINQ